jgi:hypothetical protein
LIIRRSDARGDFHIRRNPPKEKPEGSTHARIPIRLEFGVTEAHQAAAMLTSDRRVGARALICPGEKYP